MKIVKKILTLVLMLSVTGMIFAGTSGFAADVTVFAAASTTNAITEIADNYAAAGLGRVTPSFASSSTLAKQIANGAPADVYLSANKKWMDFLAEKDAIEKATRFDILGNRIVLITPTDSSIRSIDVRKGLDLTAYLGADGRLSIGDPDHVPAGMYGKEALGNLDLWTQVKDRLAPMKDVRAALLLVERAEAPVGLVYATDAAISKKVRVVGTFPLESHRPIVYPVSAVAGGNAGAAASFLNYLKTPESRAVFAKYGFETR